MSDDVPLLQAQEVHKHYRGVSALQGVSIEVRAGSITGLIGPNGSGKSTLFDCITGFQSKDQGSIRLQGHDISQLPPHQIARLGLRRTFQQLRFFPELTVRDHLLTAAQSAPGFGYLSEMFNRRAVRDHEAQMQALAQSVLHDIRLEAVADHAAVGLSYGQKKLMELGMALMTRPKLLMLDEPMAGVNPTLVEGLKQNLLDIRARGVSLLIVEHNLKLVFEICDDIYVLDQGQLLAHGTPEQIAHDPRVMQAYLGRREQESQID